MFFIILFNESCDLIHVDSHFIQPCSKLKEISPTWFGDKFCPLFLVKKNHTKCSKTLTFCGVRESTLDLIYNVYNKT